MNLRLIWLYTCLCRGEGIQTVGKLKPDVSATIWDGNTVVVEVPPLKDQPKEAGRFLFVAAQILDPAGMPIHGKMEDQDPKPDPTELTPDQQAAVKKADELALRGSQLLADGDHTTAAEKYNAALGLLPDHEMVKNRHDAYTKQFHRARKEALDAKTAHIVKKGESIFDIALQYAVSVSAIKNLNHLKSEVIEVGQLLQLPERVNVGDAATIPLPQKNKVLALEDWLKQIMIPEIDFDDVTLHESLSPPDFCHSGKCGGHRFVP